MIRTNNRVESFSDAVFAFAATLLIVSLEVPDTFAELKSQLFGFFSFGISFAGLTLIWKAHYNYFNRIKTIDNWIIGLNMALLFLILYYVYPLKFLAKMFFGGASIKFEDLYQLFVLYGIGFAAIFLILSMMYRRSHKVDTPNDDGSDLRFYSRHYLIFVGIGLLSILLAYFEIGILFGIPGWVYASLGFFCWYHAKHFDKKYKSPIS